MGEIFGAERTTVVSFAQTRFRLGIGTRPSKSFRDTIINGANCPKNTTFRLEIGAQPSC